MKNTMQIKNYLPKARLLVGTINPKTKFQLSKMNKITECGTKEFTGQQQKNKWQQRRPTK